MVGRAIEREEDVKFLPRDAKPPPRKEGRKEAKEGSY